MFLVLFVYCLLNKCQSFCAFAFLGSVEAAKYQVSKKLCTVERVSCKSVLFRGSRLSNKVKEVNDVCESLRIGESYIYIYEIKFVT